MKTTLIALIASAVLWVPLSQATEPSSSTQASRDAMHTDAASETLSERQQAIPVITALAASGDIERLETALNQGLDDGLSVSDARELLVHLYAYAGFPRSLNALNALLRVVEDRQQQGIEDDPGREPSGEIPQGEDLRAAGTANQTKLAGRTVEGPVYEFAPIINEFLQTHLFGALFERDNLDWQSRQLGTVGVLSALPGAEAQLRSHMGVSMRVGLTDEQLRQLTEVLAERFDEDAASRASEALNQALAESGG
ncbi:Uncharacterized conserved protein YurZ, alkylhydroperoxidase/carboxymuconolactone decarboxylase family [Franzmannia pantelleriensis]|uniref:Uncharacterized conserved protein YurZ, alkylhydroperoxidase/carboxymuconolactone decarboxylase family n=1 Tax=Franzmannia pantelleriensis TaxID=48727 RepID=A0A1G9R7A0_9GAMM|nr:carboxymuconolactone decarboxylase family protein [Halomonas pantelleriensis]SDM19169.1 Uncharacterized conserved protein YurZ, alkylhydroperoxidase/carboxymuconolactone decarboxylase family [Halomonas pantelleriensis]